MFFFWHLLVTCWGGEGERGGEKGAAGRSIGWSVDRLVNRSFALLTVLIDSGGDMVEWNGAEGLYK